MPTPDFPITLRVDAAAGRMRRLLNDGMLALLAGIGDRSGLLQRLCGAVPTTAAELAAATGVDARTVDSWLAAMVAGRIVDYDGARATYTLPAETAAFLAGDEGRAWRARLGELRALATTGARASGAAPATATDAGARLLDDITNLVPGLAARLMAGGLRALELACGDGALTCALGAAHPGVRCTGRDPHRARIAGARQRARGLTNVRFTCGPELPAQSAATAASFDFVVSLDEGALAPADAAARLDHVMAPGGQALLAVPATTDSPADDALHPFGAYLHGARALATAPLAPTSAQLGPRLAAAGFRVSALVRLPGDSFRNFLILEKQAQAQPQQ